MCQASSAILRKRFVQSSPRENLHGFVYDVHLDAVTIELDLVQPAFTTGNLLDRACQGWLDEAGIKRLGIDGRRLLSLERHGSHQQQ